MIELLRAYNLLGRCFSKKKVESVNFSHEHKLMHIFWTTGLK
jgi:hypothetical protein